MPSNKKTSCITLITLLVRLRAAAAARKTFLDMRTTAITGLMRRIRFEGDINAYVGDLSIVWFTGIKHTADWYLGSFRDNESTSGKFLRVYTSRRPNFPDFFFSPGCMGPRTAQDFR